VVSALTRRGAREESCRENGSALYGPGNPTLRH